MGALPFRQGLAALRVGVLLAMAVVAGVACGVLQDPGFIAYTTGPEGERDIWVVRPDGTQAHVVVEDTSDDFSPRWSPDGKRLAFLTDRDGDVEVYAVLADGSGLMRVTNSGFDESDPIWSPDGRSLAYISPDLEGKSHVHVVALHDLVPHRLTFGSVAETQIAWSPNGQWIAFVVLDEKGKSIGLFLRNPTGVNRIQITQGPDWSPAWSSDSKRLVFVSLRDDNQELYVVDIGDGVKIGEPMRLTDDPSPDYAPAWSEDRDHIAFLSERNGNPDVFTVSPKGKDLRALTTNEVPERSPVWSPDGRLAFVSGLTGKPDVFVMDAAGANQLQITGGELPNAEPDW